jgi:hypothetical protein
MGVNAPQPPTESEWNIAYTVDAARAAMATACQLRLDSIECRQRAAALRREAEDLIGAYAEVVAGLLP